MTVPGVTHADEAREAPELKRLTVEAEIKAERAMSFSGHAATFGEVDLVGDAIEPGAFTRSLKRRGAERVKLLWQHDSRMPIGTFNDIREDETGLFVEGRLLDTTLGLDVHKLLKAGAIDEMSIGFRTLKDRFDQDRNVRRLEEIELLEISLVTFAANPAARVHAVKAEDMTIRDFEKFLREAGGFSRAAAKAIAGGGFKPGSEPRDEDGLDEWLTQTHARAARLSRVGPG